MVLDDQSLNKIFRYCLALAGNESDAYDLLHDAYEKITDLPSAGIRQPLAYSRRLVKNLWVDRCRALKREVEHAILIQEADDEPIALHESSLESIVMTEKLFDKVWQLIDDNERELLYLWAVEGFSYSELAIELDVPRGTLLSRVHRIKKRLCANESLIEYGAIAHD